MSKEKERTIFRVCKNKDNPYVMLNKTCINDVRLSWKAKGILGYLLSLPDDWQIYQTELVKHSADGIKSLASGLKELENYGYLKKEYLRNEKGQFIGYNYSVYEVPTETPKAENGKTENGKRHTTNNKDIPITDGTNNNITNSNIVSQSDGQTDFDINFEDKLDDYKKNNPDDAGLINNIFSIFENMLKKDYTIIGGQRVSKKEIIYILEEISFKHILAVLENYKEVSAKTKIKNYKNYIENMIYNSVLELELKNTNNLSSVPTKNKGNKYKNDKPTFKNFKERDYDPIILKEKLLKKSRSI